MGGGGEGGGGTVSQNLPSSRILAFQWLAKTVLHTECFFIHS